MRSNALLNAINNLTRSWAEWKVFIERLVAFTTDSVHVIVGVAVLIVAAAGMRRPISSWRPWLLVLSLAAFNEFADLWIERWPKLSVQLGEGAKDIVLTMVLPTLLLLSSRYLPQLYAPRILPDSASDAEDEPSSTSAPL